MNRVNLAKYGFEKDGDAYVLPAAPNLRISKSVNNGCVYISANVASNQLTYEECKNLPKYEETAHGLAGKKTLYELQESDLQTFVENCIILSSEVDKAIATAVVPTDEELKKKYDALHAQYVIDYTEAEALYNGLAKQCILNPDVDADGYPFKCGMNYLAKAMNYAHSQASESFEDRLAKMNKSDYYYSSRVKKLDYLASTIEPLWYIKSAREYFEEALRRATEQN